MIKSTFFQQLGRCVVSESLFDQVPDIVHFVKDIEGRYVSVNKTLARRLGFEDKDELIGKKAHEVFPSPLGDGFSAQDSNILKTGAGIHARLELHIYPNGKQGWCLTYKEPLFNEQKKAVGICGISRDIHAPSEERDDLAILQKVIIHIRNNVEQPLRLPELAEMAGLSVYQLDQRIRNLHQISAGQFITQTRIEKACNLLRCTSKSIAETALECGYSDQSAFSRQFKQTTGVTPKAYRQEVH
ncbi:helix-turn-helix domain-containing protein [Rubritalea tangerina]|uniref:Helix-turn-helix domain-containing protein n=2 Tax=Rubritalea tangerina TaxID=430798 RepID=A0ABW4Z9A3_9BACT